jgi:phosphopantothenoylcysteine synthetase/decarboxylase
MKILVTCGPSYEPIDEVRRLTNFSTGELGVRLAERLARAGHEVVCLKGEGATWPGPDASCRAQPFATNDDLAAQLADAARAGGVGALFHVAALCDFRVKQVRDVAGQPCVSAKIPSRTDALTIELEPATKVIAGLRALFPKARLVGWKYELAGSRDEALARARRQLRENATDACVLNGAAWGRGFAFCTPPDKIQELPDKGALVEFLAGWL